jgi:hypothetical protein
MWCVNYIKFKYIKENLSTEQQNKKKIAFSNFVSHHGFIDYSSQTKLSSIRIKQL